MKHIVLGIIIVYQAFFSLLLKNILGIKAFCRFSPTCSEYTKQAILNLGILKGAFLGVKRIVHCHPFNHYGRNF